MLNVNTQDYIEWKLELLGVFYTITDKYYLVIL